MSSLADKLKSLGVKTGNTIPTPPKTDSHTIDSVVAGSFRVTPRGEAFVAEQTFDEDYLHGTISHLIKSPLSLISEWANDVRIAELPINKFAFLAIPLAKRTLQELRRESKPSASQPSP